MKFWGFAEFLQLFFCNIIVGNLMPFSSYLWAHFIKISQCFSLIGNQIFGVIHKFSLLVGWFALIWVNILLKKALWVFAYIYKFNILFLWVFSQIHLQDNSCPSQGNVSPKSFWRMPIQKGCKYQLVLKNWMDAQNTSFSQPFSSLQ